MPEAICNVPVPRTPQELEQAVRRYQASDLAGTELFCCWQAIRDASLAQLTPEAENDQVAGEDSY